jgi:uncharacterized protein
VREVGAEGNVRRRKPARCPICARPRDPAHRPFCSARCRDVDLARWFNQVYSIPTAEPDGGPDEESDEQAPQ